jgi:hypothetical protein
LEVADEATLLEGKRRLTERGVDGYADPRFSGAHCLNVT